MDKTESVLEDKQELYQARFEELCNLYGVIFDQGPDMSGMMYVEEEPPRIEVASFLPGQRGAYPNQQSKYAAALHEIGHCVYGHTQGRPPYESKKFYFENGVLRSEAQAWEFCLDNIGEPIESATRRFMWYTCLGSYYSAAVRAAGAPERLGNGNRHWVQFVYDEPDDYFWSVVKRIGYERSQVEIKPVTVQKSPPVRVLVPATV